MLRDKDNSAGFAVEAVDERKGAPIREFENAKVLESIEESRRIPRNGRMDEQMRRFIDDEKVVILIEDREIRRLESQVDNKSYS